MRNLATVQTIKSLEDIKGKDRIKLASFVSTGFKCIVGLDCSVGDKVLYFEMDSLIPATLPEFEFLRARCYKEKYNAYHIKCMRMAGVYSEGLAYRFPENGIVKVESASTLLVDGLDLTESYSVKKYDPEAEQENKQATNGKTAKASWLRELVFSNRITTMLFGRFFKKLKGYGDIFKYIGKSDQTRVQNLDYIYEELKDEMVVGSIKMDGQSMTVGSIKGKLFIASRNITLDLKAGGKYTVCAKENNLFEALKAEVKATGHDLIIQGESCGDGIQGNKYQFKRPMFFLYDIKDATTGKYYDRIALERFSRKYGILLVEKCYFGPMFADQDSMQALSDSLVYTVGGNTLPHEGVVFRLIGEQKAPKRGMSNYIGWKVISTKFNEKYHSK